MASTIRKTHPLLTPQRLAELAELAKKIDREEGEEIKAKGRAIFDRHEAIVNLISGLKAARIEKGLTLETVGEKSGIGKANVSRLENDRRPNPTWDTLARYAEAVGKSLVATLK